MVDQGTYKGFLKYVIFRSFHPSLHGFILIYSQEIKQNTNINRGKFGCEPGCNFIIWNLSVGPTSVHYNHQVETVRPHIGLGVGPHGYHLMDTTICLKASEFTGSMNKLWPGSQKFSSAKQSVAIGYCIRYGLKLERQYGWARLQLFFFVKLQNFLHEAEACAQFYATLLLLLFLEKKEEGKHSKEL